MSKYIEADALIDNMIDYVVDGYAESPADFESYEKMAQTAPSIDIVHCRECKSSHMTYGGECKYCECWKDDDDNYIELYLDGDFFCGFGERESER